MWGKYRTPHDQRTGSAYIFSAACSKEGKGAASIRPACNTNAIDLHLVEVARTSP